MQINQKPFFLLCFFSLLSIHAYAKEMFVAVPVLDVRLEPLKDATFKPTYPMLASTNGKLYTQLLYGERVVLLSDAVDGWVKVETQQKRSDKDYHDKLISIGGYVLQKSLVAVSKAPSANATIIKPWVTVYKKPTANAAAVVKLSYGTRLYAQSHNDTQWIEIVLIDGAKGYVKKDEVLFCAAAKQMTQAARAMFVQKTVKQLLGSPYVQGGASAHDSTDGRQTTGTNCSGLTYLIYNRALCIGDFPRNSIAQYFQAPTKIASGSDLQPADLIFTANRQDDGSVKIKHVLMYLGDGVVAESTAHGFRVLPSDQATTKTLCIKMKPVQDRFGVMKNTLKNAAPCLDKGSRFVFLARY